MKKSIQYIAILISLFLVSCTSDDIYNPDINIHQKKNQIQIATRFAPFDEYDVASRAAGDDKIVYDFIIFGSDGNCVYYRHCEDDIINIDRASDFAGISQDVLASCDMYVLANYTGIYNKIEKDAADAGYSDVESYIKDNIIGKALDYFNIATEVKPVVNMSENALPRIGRYSETIDLRTSANIASGTIYPIELQSLYAKMVFDIEVDPTEEILDIYNSNTFQIKGYTVKNLAKEVDLWSGTEGKTDDQTEVHTQVVEGVLGDDVPTGPVTRFSFSCYLPERFVLPEPSASAFVYPFGTGNNIREEDLERRQRYKPLLGKGYAGYNSEYDASKDKKATFVTLSGVFTNHQGHTFDVSYDVYVGKDNFGNFDVVRNRQYNNTITIKGIQNSSDQSANDGAVSIDHRVNVTRTLPIIASLRRETLLDAHFEVRPLRIRANMLDELNANAIRANSAVKVEVIYENGEDNSSTDKLFWIGLERSYGDGIPESPARTTYCDASINPSSAGKRLYFTTDLVYETLKDPAGTTGADGYSTSGGQSVIVPVTEDNQCVWIYVDECTDASASINDFRTAQIKLTYGTVVGGTFQEYTDVAPLIYTMSQHKLCQVSYTDENGETRTYHIEHEEEYLHNFDSEDTYDDNKTEFQGMEWGLYNTQLSFTNPALYLEGGILDFISGWINSFVQSSGIKPYYDFYIPKHDKDVSEDAVKRDYSGWVFCDEIISKINTPEPGNVTGYDGKIRSLCLDEQPMSAIEYAYNRNKRNSDGTIASHDWYLPAIDEMEDIMMGGHGNFLEFHDQYYWSCQPSYLTNFAHHHYTFLFFQVHRYGIYYTDDIGIYDDSETEKTVKYNVGYARATKAEHETGNTYKDVPSGTLGYDNAIDIDGDNGNSYTMHYIGKDLHFGDSIIDLENWTTPEPESITRQDGNFERSTKLRVRCVRKSP